MTVDRRAREAPRQHASQARRKVTLYLDDPQHFDLIDGLLTALRQAAHLPRDQSMLARALLDQAASVMDDAAALGVLARACEQTLPNR